MADPPVDMSLLEWVVGGIGVVITGIGGVLLRRVDNATEVALGFKDDLEKNIVDNERRFATKGEVAELRNTMNARFDRLEEAQRNGLDLILSKLDRIAK